LAGLAGVLVVLGVLGEADAPPVLAAEALVAPPATTVTLHSNAPLKVRNRKTTTSFVGLRG